MDIISMTKQFVYTTSNHVFLTGKAGTGKTTLLKEIYANSPKKTAIVAPTGIAALNAGGSTIHSFFQIPPVTFIPQYRGNIPVGQETRVYDQKNLLRKLKMFRNKRRLLSELELLIIDEVSMLRADLLDAIDVVLRYVRKSKFPFGGVQILFIGDLLQLPPVVLSSEKGILQKHYRSEYFFDAHALKNKRPVYLNLEKVHRQSDQQFIDLLNRLRTNSLNFDDKVFLKSKMIPGYEAPINSGIISLTTHNRRADLINDQNLRKLKGSLYRYSANLEGEFNENNYPTLKELSLKTGAQVMFLKNDQALKPRYYNGKVGIIEQMNENTISVKCKGDDELIHLKRYKWENIQFVFNEKTRKMEERVKGSFEQFPVKLAWAITIHKSQGLSFDEAVIDCEASFSSGQLYVALSRMRNTDGLILSTPLPDQDIPGDQRLNEFERSRATDEELKKLANSSSLAYLIRKIHNVKLLGRSLMTLSGQHESLINIHPELSSIKNLLIEHTGLASSTLKLMDAYESALMDSSQSIKSLEVKDLLNIILRGMSASAERLNTILNLNFSFNSLHELEIWIEISDQLREKWLEWYDKTIQSLQLMALHRETVDEHASIVLTRNKVDALIKSATSRSTTEPKGKSKKAGSRSSGKSEMQTEVLFRQGLSIAEIAKTRELKYSTIQSHIRKLVHSDRIKAEEYISPEKKELIFDFLSKNPEMYASHLEDIHPTEYSKIELELGYILYRKQLREMETA